MNICARIRIQFIVTTFFGGGELSEIYYFFLIYSFINFNWYFSRRWNRELRILAPAIHSNHYFSFRFIRLETSIFIERLFVCSFAFIFTYASQFLNRTSTYLYGLRSTGIHYTTAPLQVLIGGHWKKNSNVSKPLEFFCNYVWLPFFFSVDFQCICAPPVTLYERISKCNNQKRSALFLELRNEKALIAVGGLEIGVHTYDFVLHHNVTL